MNLRLQRLTLWLKNSEVDLALIQDPSNLLYLTGFECEPHERLLALFILPGQSPFIVCPRLEENRLRLSGWSNTIITYEDAEDPWQKIAACLKERGMETFTKAAVEVEQLSYMRAEALRSLSPNSRLISVNEELGRLRSVKDDREIETMKKAAHLADEGVKAGIAALKEGCTELDVVAHIEYEMKRKGVRAMSFSTMVLFGEKTGDPHGTPGTRRLKKGDLVLFDLGVVWEGYCSDITRTVAFHSIEEETRQIYETVLKAQTAALNACRPGAPIGEIDRVARTIIKEAGYGPYFPHRLGHGLGIEAHESPSIHEENRELFTAGLAFTVEPGVYIPGKGGIRIEDDVVITAEGHERLTRFPKELQIVN